LSLKRVLCKSNQRAQVHFAERLTETNTR